MPWADALGTSPFCAAADAGGNAAAAAAAPAAISQAPSTKTFDVVHLGNLCLDIIVPVDQLPPPDIGLLPWRVVQPLVLNLCLLNHPPPAGGNELLLQPSLYILRSTFWRPADVATCHQSVHIADVSEHACQLCAWHRSPHSIFTLLKIYADLPEPCRAAARAELLANLTATPPPQTAWEVGGASNFMIAAARLGQRVASVGQLGDDVYGAFFRRVMQVCVSLLIFRFHILSLWSWLYGRVGCQLYRHSLLFLKRAAQNKEWLTTGAKTPTRLPWSIYRMAEHCSRPSG